MAEQKAAASSKAAQEGSVLSEIMEYTMLEPQDEGYEVARQGVEALVKELFGKKDEIERVDKRLVDQMIVDLDRRLSEQMDAILHHENFLKIESTWRGLKFMVDRTEFRENIKVELINASKEDILEDFEDADDLTTSGLYRHIYTEEYGQFGGQPVGVVIGDYEFTPAGNDIKLLSQMGQLGGMTHAPFISAASPKFFGTNDFSDLPQLKELEALFEGPQYAKWRGLRDADEARNIGLTLPSFMARQPYGEDNPIREFSYVEQANGDKSNYVWSNAAYAFATRLTESFASYRWCPNIIGPTSGGAVKDLPVDVVDDNGQKELFGPVEVTISDRREYELSEQGFIPLTLRKGSDNACFFSASSIQKPKMFGNDAEGKQAELNYRLGTQLPYLFIVNRLAHYIKVLQRENLGSWKSRAELEGELNKWLRQYVADQDNPSPATRSQRPLRKAELSVTEVEGEAGWYKVDLAVTPHFKFMGANLTLSLSGMLDRV